MAFLKFIKLADLMRGERERGRKREWRRERERE
jgi:hypothetical protein